MSAATLAAMAAAFATWCAVRPRAHRRCRSVFMRPSVHRASVDPVAAVTVLVPVAALVVLGPMVGLVVGLVVTPAARGAVRGMETAAARRRSELLSAQLPVALDLVVATLEAGQPPHTGFTLVGSITPEPLGGELTQVGARLAVGGDPDAIWSHLAADAVLGPVGRAFRRASVSGMPVARVVASVADELRRERRAALRQRSRRVGVRTAAPLGACFLPAFFLIGVVPTVIGLVGSLSL